MLYNDNVLQSDDVDNTNPKLPQDFDCDCIFAAVDWKDFF